MVLDPSHCGGMTEAVRVLTPSAGHSLTLKKKEKPLRGNGCLSQASEDE